MKKLITIFTILTIISCKKQQKTLGIAQTPQQSNCGLHGACLEGYYYADSTRIISDPTFDTIANMIIHLKYNGDSIKNNIIFCKYKLDSSIYNYNFIPNETINSFNSIIWRKNMEYSDTMGIVTKTNKRILIYKF